MKLHEILRESQERDLMGLRRTQEWGDKWIGNIDCGNKGLTSLNGAPNEVRGYFHCGNNYLTSLEGGPDKVTGDFHCQGNYLDSLKGGPREVGENFYCFNNPIGSLSGIGNYFKNGYIKKWLVIPESISSHILGTLMIPKLQVIAGIMADSTAELPRAMRIINRHLKGDRDLLECQEELRSAGLREYGKL